MRATTTFTGQRPNRTIQIAGLICEVIRVNSRFAAALLVTQSLFGGESDLGERLSIGGETQLLAMERDFGQDVEGSSVSVSATVDIEAAIANGLKLTGQYVHVENLAETGRDDAAYWLSNDDASGLTLAYLQLDGKSGPWESAKLSVGRLPAAYDFFPAYKARHTAQSFEGAVFETAGPRWTKLVFGHIGRYSSWPSREGGSSCLNAEFMDLADRNGFSTGDSGIQFATIDWAGDRVSIVAHDYRADGFYNNFGAKVSVALTDRKAEHAWSATARVDTQSADASGAMPNQNATVAEANLTYRRSGFTVSAGWTNISGEAHFATPFRTSYSIDATLLWYTNQFERGTNSLHCNAVYKRGKWMFANVLTAAWHQDDRREEELDIVVKRSFERGLWLAFKGGHGRRNFAPSAARHDERARDLRVFAGYAF